MSARGYMLRSARGDWRTPPEIVAAAREALGGAIDLDPCASSDPNAPMIGEGENFTAADDGLSREWCGRVFVNPPFGDLAKWTAKARDEAKDRLAEIVFLLPARTDTSYWHLDIATARLVCFLRGRLRFVGAPGPCPFPTALAYWGDRPALFHAAFAPLGMVVVAP